MKEFEELEEKLTKYSYVYISRFNQEITLVFVFLVVLYQSHLGCFEDE